MTLLLTEKPVHGQGQSRNSYTNGRFCLLNGNMGHVVQHEVVMWTFREKINLLRAKHAVYEGNPWDREHHASWEISRPWGAWG
jgi:hypothetical protein